jgi:hypothetical protein
VELSLYSNRLGTPGALALAAGLRENRTLEAAAPVDPPCSCLPLRGWGGVRCTLPLPLLEVLDLAGNPIGDRGGDPAWDPAWAPPPCAPTDTGFNFGGAPETGFNFGGAAEERRRAKKSTREDIRVSKLESKRSEEKRLEEELRELEKLKLQRLEQLAAIRTRIQCLEEHDAESPRGNGGMRVTAQSIEESRELEVDGGMSVHEALCAAFGILDARLGEVSFGDSAVLRGDTFEEHGIEVIVSRLP